jgi:hypothetical protein
VTEINKRHNSFLLFVQISLSEETVSKSGCGTLVDKSIAVNSSDIGGIEVSRSLSVRGIIRDRDDNLF